MGRQSQLNPLHRIDAVLALMRREEPAGQIAKRFGVSEATLYRYRDQFLEGGKAALTNGKRSKGNGHEGDIERLQSGIAHRDRVIGELTIANRMLRETFQTT